MPAFPAPIRRHRLAALTTALLAGAPGVAQASDFSRLIYVLLYLAAVPVICVAVFVSATAWRQPGWISGSWGLTLALLLTPWYVKYIDDALILVSLVAVACGLVIHGLLRYLLARRPTRYDASRSPLAQAQQAAADESAEPPKN